jgi:hypothetical protein
MLVDICRDEDCRRLGTDQRNPHPLHGGQTLPVEITFAAREDTFALRHAGGGLVICAATRVSGGIWPADVTLVDLAATAAAIDGLHKGGTVSVHSDVDREVEVSFYPA